jgi:ribonuclease HI
MADYTIVFDGGSRGNPGQGYGSYQITRASDGKTRLRRLEYPGQNTTNNEAEYLTLIEALQELTTGIQKAGHDPRQFSVEVQGDSQLVLKQVEGVWKVNEARLRPLRDKAQDLLRQFGRSKLAWHRRAKSVAVLGH